MTGVPLTEEELKSHWTWIIKDSDSTANPFDSNVTIDPQSVTISQPQTPSNPFIEEKDETLLTRDDLKKLATALEYEFRQIFKRLKDLEKSIDERMENIEKVMNCQHKE